MAGDLPTLRRLHGWLTLESLAGPAWLVGYWLPAGLLAAVLGAAAVAFVPVLVHGLWRLGRRGWLVAFGVVVALSATASLALPPTWGLFRFGVALLPFYAFTWVLGLVVREWLREAEEAVRWAHEKARWAAERDAELAALGA